MHYVYTDGSCSGNPGPGGWAWLISNGVQVLKTESGRFPTTTNNQMELQAVIQSLRHLTKYPIGDLTVRSDSKYVIDGMRVYLDQWKKADWKTSKKTEVKNRELWEELSALQSSYPSLVFWEWVKGHGGDPNNELVDKLARG